MDASTNEGLKATLERIKNTPPVKTPYYNEQGYKAHPESLERDGYWPSPDPQDLPAEVTDWRDEDKS